MPAENHLRSSWEDKYPLHALDDTKPNRMFVNWLMRFNDVLDANLLNNALSRLLEIGDWKKLGGRLSYAGKNNLEVKVSSPSTEKNNVFFTHDTYCMRIHDHPVASQLPHETSGPSIQPIIDDFRPFAARRGFPSTVDELIRLDLPQLSLHITSFKDATLVSLTWPHTLMDALGGQALLAAWSSVLAGREEEVPNVIGAREDVLLEVVDTVRLQERFKLEPKRLKGASLLTFALRQLWDSLWNPPRDWRVVFLPKDTFARIREQAHRDVVERARDLDKTPFVSEADVIAAWAAKAVAMSEPRPRPITALSVVNARFRLPQLMNSNGVFIQNMLLATYTFLSAQRANGPVGEIALSHRENLNRQSTEGQTLSFLKSLFQDVSAGRNPRLLFGEPNAVPILFNNVVKAELMKAANFNPAVLRQGEESETRRNPVGTMVTYHVQALDQSCRDLNMFVILGKDRGDNYWVSGNLLPRVWAKIEEEIRNT